MTTETAPPAIDPGTFDFTAADAVADVLNMALADGWSAQVRRSPAGYHIECSWKGAPGITISTPFQAAMMLRNALLEEQAT